jgi:hypothetical protein
MIMLNRYPATAHLLPNIVSEMLRDHNDSDIPYTPAEFAEEVFDVLEALELELQKRSQAPAPEATAPQTSTPTEPEKPAQRLGSTASGRIVVVGGDSRRGLLDTLAEAMGLSRVDLGTIGPDTPVVPPIPGDQCECPACVVRRAAYGADPNADAEKRKMREARDAEIRNPKIPMRDRES